MTNPTPIPRFTHRTALETLTRLADAKAAAVAESAAVDALVDALRRVHTLPEAYGLACAVKDARERVEACRGAK